MKALKLWTLKEQRIRADLTEVYKMLNGLSDVSFLSMFTLDSTKRTRGHSYKLIKSRFNTNLCQHFFSERVIKFWKSLADSTFTKLLQTKTGTAKTSTKDGSTIGQSVIRRHQRPSQLVRPRPVSYPVSHSIVPSTFRVPRPN